VIATESKFTAVVDLDDGEQVCLTGYADRLELDAEGRVVVVDLKSGRKAPTKKSVDANVQLGLYQYAVDSGAVDDLTDGPVVAGGAELVQLGLENDRPEAVVQPQGVQADDGPERAELRAQLARSAALVRAESFPAVAGDHCRDCEFVPVCPIKSAGAVMAQ
jgi:RecB family exonuclease